MPIIFYFMNGCGFCDKAKNMFANEISSGDIVVVPSSKAPSGVNGFPHFSHNGKSHSGLPQSKKQLYDKLGYVSEGYTREYSGIPVGGRYNGWSGSNEGYCNSKRKKSDNEYYAGVF